ncbi:MAG: ketoacyl-ACP synthase III [Roseiflexus sp.]|nr:ketoacyl-ACP synthase III [Roseiflexus sp.]MCS7287679.1 ketoacyl-ACP synthase III [Roseiflexus sp.]MDW8147876.1 beta-ketoacyl-ACP synthase III [Roseiflexaceae bacterium]MDW8233694.1 beta-ketoacyl-ACP synthase III [Roseiflexaceae bacterium]
MANFAAITGWGMAVPERVLTNADLERMVETSDEWIQTRTGIRERRIAGPGEHTSALSIAAGRAALARAGLDASRIDTVILATCTPDRPFPATACAVQAGIGARRAAAFDVVAACSGFVYGLQVATSMVRSGAARNVLFVACDIFTHFINWNDRNTCVLFGDGAGAVVLQPSDEPAGLLSCVLGADGEQEDLMAVDAGGTRLPATPELLEQGRQYVYMNGREIFKHAVREMVASSLDAIQAAGLSTDDIALVIPHQANLRIIEATAKRLEVPMDRVFVNLDRYGNTSAASVPIALVEAVEQQRLRKGDYALLTAFGGGLTWASAVIRWSAD